jgi:hypothetical protein
MSEARLPVSASRDETLRLRGMAGDARITRRNPAREKWRSLMGGQPCRKIFARKLKLFTKKLKLFVRKLKPPAKKLKPRAQKLKPRAKKLEPRAKKLEPRAQKLKPPAKKLKPRAQKLKPRAQKLKPRAQKLKPRAQKPKPRVKKLEPRVGVGGHWAGAARRSSPCFPSPDGVFSRRRVAARDTNTTKRERGTIWIDC